MNVLDIKNVKTYTPRSVPTKELLDDWRIVVAWYSRILEKKPLVHDKETIINIAHLIYNELIKRKIRLKPEEGSPAYQRLLNIVRKGEIIDEPELAEIKRASPDLGRAVDWKEIVGYFRDFYARKPVAWLVGGTCHKKEGTTGDIDILIRKTKCPANDMAMEFRIYRQLPKELWSRVHFLYDDFHGPFTDCVPIYNEIYEATRHPQLENMSADFDDAVPRHAPEELKKQAATSQKQNKIVPFRFFTQLKGVVGYRKGEVYTIAGLKELIEEEDYPVETDQKFDGFRVQVHKVGKDIMIWSEDGGEKTERFPTIAKEILRWPFDVVIDGELTGWTGGKYRKGEHIGRSDVAGYSNAKTPIDDEKYHLNVFDLVWWKPRTAKDGNDIHDEPLSVRRKQLEKLPSGINVHIIEMKLANSPADLKKTVEWASKFPGSEGAMIKSFASKYPLSGHTSKWIKYKIEADLDAEVIQVHDVEKQKSYNYLCVVRDIKGNPVPVGRTYNTDIKAKAGDIIRVSFVNLNKYTDPKTGEIWYNWWAPRVIELREDKNRPDNTVTANRIVRETAGEDEIKKYPKRYQVLLKDAEISRRRIAPAIKTKARRALTYTKSRMLTTFEKADYLMLPNKKQVEKTAEAILNAGITRIITAGISKENRTLLEGIGVTIIITRVAKVSDWGFELDNDVDLFTIDIEDAEDIFLLYPDERKKWPGAVQAHIRGRSVHLDLRMQLDEDFLIGWTIFVPKGLSRVPKNMTEAWKLYRKEIEPILKEHLSDPKQKLNSGPKAPEPVPWLKFEGKVEPGEVGATRFLPGYFLLIDEFETQWGAQKPWFHEYFMDGRLFKGRFVLRLLENKKQWKRTPEGLLTWMLFNAAFEPYAISKRAVQQKWIPPKDVSALPRVVRAKIPTKFQYWKHDSTAKRKSVRDELVKEISAKEVSLDVEKLEFKLQRQTWRGPIVIRRGPSREEYHLLIKFGENKYLHYVTEQDALNPPSAGVVNFLKNPMRWNAEGDIKPKTTLNPTKETPSRIELVDKGTAVMLINKKELYKMMFKDSKKLRGLWLLAPEAKGANIWKFDRTEEAPS